MLNRTPVAISQPVLAHPKQRAFCAVGWVLFWFALAQSAPAEQVVSMPQTRSFIDAYQVALKLSQDYPGSRIMSVASTYSMYPTLDWDSIVIIAPVAIEKVQVGALVCFRDRPIDGERMIVHRVEKVLQKDHRLVTRGDNLDRADLHPVGADALIGLAVCVVYFDRTGEKRPVDQDLPTPSRPKKVVPLL